MNEAPKAPWHPFPLVELAILAGIVLTIAGFVVRGRSGGILVSGGVLLVAVGALEVAIREHVTGFRSHTALLAGVIAVPLVGVLLFAGVPRIAALAVGVGAGAGAFVTLRRMFVRKAGGLTWRA